MNTQRVIPQFDGTKRGDGADALQYIKNELDRYIPATQLTFRAEDRLMECIAKRQNPFEWVYCEVYEEINFKKAVYFRWEKLV